jgi:hypothetical protein
MKLELPEKAFSFTAFVFVVGEETSSRFMSPPASGAGSSGFLF